MTDNLNQQFGTCGVNVPSPAPALNPTKISPEIPPKDLNLNSGETEKMEPWSETEKRLAAFHKLFCEDLRFADQKAGAILTLSSALLGAAIAYVGFWKPTFDSNKLNIYRWAVTAIYSFGFLAVLTALAAIFPRSRPHMSWDVKGPDQENPNENVEESVDAEGTKSTKPPVIPYKRLLHGHFVGDALKGHSYGTLRHVYASLRNYLQIELLYTYDAERVARIIKKKYFWVRFALIAISMEIASIFISILIATWNLAPGIFATNTK